MGVGQGGGGGEDAGERVEVGVGAEALEDLGASPVHELDRLPPSEPGDEGLLPFVAGGDEGGGGVGLYVEAVHRERGRGRPPACEGELHVA